MSDERMLLPANPKAGYLAHKQALDDVYHEAMQGGWYILGPKVKAFEEHFAAYVGAAHCVGVASGTDAVNLALRACGVVSGDGVITVAHTAVATVSAIDWLGARPVLVDIDPRTFTMDPQKVNDTLRKTPAGYIKAIVPVHLYGHPADMASLTEIAQRYGALLIEDCAQAHGAATNDRKVGSIGTCGAFSFYPTKNLGGFGDGGGIVTGNTAVAEKLRLLQQYGWRERYISAECGYNSRLDELQAAMLDCKLGWLDDDNARRREIAKLYTEGLQGLPLCTPTELPGNRHVYHQYTIRTGKRNDLRNHLEKQGIHTAILYPVPIHLQPGYQNRVEIGAGGMAETERAASEILSLPMYPELQNADVAGVTDAIKSYFMP